MKQNTPRECGNCTYSRPNDEHSISCQRYPPTITKVEDNRITTHFPLVLRTMICGEWKQRPRE